MARRQNIKWRNSIRWKILVRNGTNCIFPREMHSAESASRDKITGNAGLSRRDSSIWNYRRTYVCIMYIYTYIYVCTSQRIITCVAWSLKWRESCSRIRVSFEEAIMLHTTLSLPRILQWVLLYKFIIRAYINCDYSGTKLFFNREWYENPFLKKEC